MCILGEQEKGPNCVNGFPYEIASRYAHTKKEKTLNVECDLCDFKVSSKKGLILHKRRVHGFRKAGDLQCDQCEKSFESYFGLKFHQKKFHNVKFKVSFEKDTESNFQNFKTFPFSNTVSSMRITRVPFSSVKNVEKSTKLTRTCKLISTDLIRRAGATCVRFAERITRQLR